MKQKIQFTLIVLLIALLGVLPVSAETLTGTLGSSAASIVSYSVPHYNPDTQVAGFNMYAVDIQNIGETYSLVKFDESGIHQNFNTKTPAGNTSLFYGVVEGQTVCTGTFGYMRNFDGTGNEIAGYQFMVFNFWNVTGKTGGKTISITFNDTYALNGFYPVGYNGTQISVAGRMAFLGGNGYPLTGDYIRTIEEEAYAEYTATSPSGIGITGYITKLIDGEQYSGIVGVFNGTTNANIVVQDTTSTYPLSFSTVQQPIIIGFKSPSGTWYNSSVLFATVTPTVTLTPTTTIPPGYVRTYAYTSDCISGARIAESDISFYNHNTSVWSNSSQDPDGKYYIDTAPYQTISIYGAYTKTASQYGTDSYTSQNVGLYGGQSFALQLCPTQLSPGTGNTNVLVTVYDTTNYLPLQYTTVSLKLTSTGATTIDSTGTSGTASFVTTNNSVITLTASKSGYITGSKTLTTSSTTLTTAKIYLDKQIITTAPTLTAVPGGTIPTTIDPAGTPDSSGNYPDGYSSVKGQQMLNWLASNGLSLVQLCFVVTLLALLGVKFGK